tara:strand:- start:589 stop:795 length:207 start_codon:yes stop_codon:yes gene_type:complete
MATLTLDEVEYETDNFNELQEQIVGEIQYNNNVQTQLNYQLQGLRSMGDSLVARLKKELTETTKTESE